MTDTLRIAYRWADRNGIGEPTPVVRYGSRQWETGNDEDEALAQACSGLRNVKFGHPSERAQSKLDSGWITCERLPAPGRTLARPQQEQARCSQHARHGCVYCHVRDRRRADLAGGAMNRDELVSKMIDTWFSMGDGDAEGQKRRMSAALDVAVAELLQPVTDQDKLHERWTNALLASRRSRLLKPKSVEERVTVQRLTVGAAVLVDGKQQIHLDEDSQAEIYRLGLIAKLKGEA